MGGGGKRSSKYYEKLYLEAQQRDSLGKFVKSQDHANNEPQEQTGISNKESLTKANNVSNIKNAF